MPILRSRKSRIAASLVPVVVALGVGGGLAYGYWTGGGVGVGTASTGTSSNFTVTSPPSPDPALTPGGVAQTVDFTVTNPGTGSQNLTSVVISVANANGTAWSAVLGCSSADYAIGTPSIVYGQIAGGANLTGTVTVTMNNLATNQDACQGVTAPLYFVAR